MKLKKNILVTGSAGFIGFHTAKKLLDKGHEVVGIDNLNDYYSVQLKKQRLSILKQYENFSLSWPYLSLYTNCLLLPNDLL